MHREPDVPPDEPDAARSNGETKEEHRADQEHLRGLQQARQARVAKALVALAIVVILVVFIISNSQPVEVDFVLVTRHPRLIWVMFTCAVLGGILGYLVGSPGMRAQLHRKRKRERKGSR
jgi:uncharacterized integral membrane protein